MKRNILTLFILSFIYNSFAVTAFPEKVLFIQPNGEKVTIQMNGDEYVKFASSLDGYTLLYDQNGFFNYAFINAEGNLVPSVYHAKEISVRTREEVYFLNSISSNLFFSPSQMNSMIFIRESIENKMSQNAPPSAKGTMRLLCILMDFPDKPFIKTNEDFQNLFNQVGYDFGGASGSVHDYYAEVSNNVLNIQFDVLGPYSSSENMAYYGSNSYGDASQLAYEAIEYAKNVINFSDYDNDNDGIIDGLYIIFAGNGEEAGAGADAIWSHKGWVSKTYNGVLIDGYACSPEHRGASGSSITYIGVICHELGHVLGAPDYYDTNYETGGSYDGTGNWDIMASGSWNNGGRTPAHHNPRSKVYTYQWAETILLSTAQTVLLPPNLYYANAFYRINTNTNNEYFILENRTISNFNIGIPGSGMLIFRCASTVNQGSNSVNATHKQKFYPVAANSSQPLPTANTYGTINAPSCAWPGTLNKTSFTDATNPSMKSWANANTNKPITNISLNPANNFITFDFMGGGTPSAYYVFIPQRVGVVVTPTLTSSSPVAANGSFSFYVNLANTHSNSNIFVRVGNDTLTSVNDIYTIQYINANQVIEILNVELNKHLIVASAGQNGSISPSGSSYVNHNGFITYTFTPTVGYGVANVIVDNDTLGILDSYTFTYVTDTHSIEVLFGIGSPNIIHTDQNYLYFTTFQNVPSNAQTSLISADVAELTINILVKAPTHFQVSLNGTSWVSQLVIQKSNLPKEVYIRFNPSIVGNVSDTITIASSGALTYLFVSGTSTLSIQDLNLENEIKMFPNPAKNNTTIVIPDQLVRQNSYAMIYDSSGKLLSQFTLQNSETNMETKQWVSGIYYVIIYSDSKIYTKKLLII